jgi:hypothetical protein
MARFSKGEVIHFLTNPNMGMKFDGTRFSPAHPSVCDKWRRALVKRWIDFP